MKLALNMPFLENLGVEICTWCAQAGYGLLRILSKAPRSTR